ncbi:MAG: hypothetical protein KF861_16925, partial [Planctomycetaceae bacterium]|nr:hypothetical protein [Planctomycetaceae bacterium]
MNVAGLSIAFLGSLCLASIVAADSTPSIVVVDEQRDDAGGRSAIDRGISWLLQQQSDVGGWHSQTYGNMKAGVGITGLVLATLAESPAIHETRTKSAFRRGVNYLAAGRGPQELVCAPEGSIDYPVYATALLLTAISQMPDDDYRSLSGELGTALISV